MDKVEQLRQSIGLVSLCEGKIPTERVRLLVIAGPKAGKSCLATTLFDWPNKGDRPLVIALDETGPDSCAQLGYAVSAIKINDARLVGNNWARIQSILQRVEDAFARGRRDGIWPYSSIVVDCGSRLLDKLLEDMKDAADERQRFGYALKAAMQFFERLSDIGVPLVFLAWLEPSLVVKNGSKSKGTYSVTRHLGGPMISGSFKHRLAGMCEVVLYMEKQKVVPKTPGADKDGNLRVFHTRMTDFVECGGRFPLPEPVTPARLDTVLSMIYGMVENPAAVRVTELIR